jgi:hypothetical protein
MAGNGIKNINQDIQNKSTLECLQKILDETQETIRAYDTKAEILAILITLVVGIVNFGFVTDACSDHCGLKIISVISMSVGILSLFPIGMVLYPRKNLFDGINVGEFHPKRTYFVSLDIVPEFTDFEEYLRRAEETDWKKEIAYEVLKTSRIRNHKHYWFNIGILSAAATIFCTLLLLLGVSFYG